MNEQKTTVTPMSGYYGLDFAGLPFEIDGEKAIVLRFADKMGRRIVFYRIIKTGRVYFEYMDNIEYSSNYYSTGGIMEYTREDAEARVDATPELEAHRDTILYDWPEGEEHWEWVCTAPVAEIVGWAEVVGEAPEEAVALGEA